MIAIAPKGDTIPCGDFNFNIAASLAVGVMPLVGRWIQVNSEDLTRKNLSNRTYQVTVRSKWASWVS
jgi:hypothetical protein